MTPIRRWAQIASITNRRGQRRALEFHESGRIRVLSLVDFSPSWQKLCLIALCSAGALAAQGQPSAAQEPQEPGSVEGLILNNATGQPLRRAEVTLKGVDRNDAGRFQVTAEDGKFSFPKVAPGRYAITVQRDGFLRQTAGRLGSYKMPPIFSVRPGESAGKLEFPMVPAGLVSGKIKFDDAEPARNVAVQLYREYYDRRRHGYLVAASGFTNDLGEFRLGGLDPGSYFVAALYRAPAPPPNAEEQFRTDQAGSRLRDLSYAVTFFPEALRMGDAVAIRVGPGQEVGGIDIFLTLVHTVRIRGRVISATSGQTVQAPTLALRWNDPDNTGSVTAPIDVTFDKDHNFEIKGVTPGPYWLIASGVDNGKTLTARTPLNVGSENADGLNIVIGPESLWKGTVRLEGEDTVALAGMVVSLQPRRPTAAPTQAEVSDKGEFTIPFWPNETYDLYLLNTPDNVYLKSVQVASADRLSLGLEAEAGDAPPPINITLSTRGGEVTGRAVTSDSSIVASGATLMLLPDPPDGRIQAYKLAFADEYGNFLIRGVAPGRYVLLAWMDQAPCEIYDPEDLAACRSRGVPVTVAEGSGENVQVTAN